MGQSIAHSGPSERRALCCADSWAPSAKRRSAPARALTIRAPPTLLTPLPYGGSVTAAVARFALKHLAFLLLTLLVVSFLVFMLNE